MTLPPPLQQIDRTYVRYQNQKYTYFGGCDYFRLASHPAVLAAVHTGLNKFGLNVAASRLTTGNHALFPKLEKALAEFFKVESATLVSNGYVTNLVAAQTLAGNFSHGLIDERSHPSLTDAAKFLGCPILKFQHRDANDLKRAANRCGRSARIILLTDGMFSHDGAIAPLKTYLKILPRDAMILVDDAHGAGTLGANGRGSIELERVNRNQIVQTITLSKAFGVYGGAILGARDLREKIFAKSHLFVGSTPLPLP
ncbi:MAG: aminotransferase class I/II-fold pyridoxal phosphate-dependent enzyme, partial [Limisphaerales bacterium]